MPAPPRYHETAIPVRAEPALAMAHLARSGPWRAYAAYEHASHWAFAGDPIAEITVDRDAVHLRQGRSSQSRPWRDSPLATVAQLLEEAGPRRWRAYGWAAFELSYLGTPLFDTVGSQTLLHLIVPGTEVRLENGQARVRSTSAAAADRVRRLLATPADEPRHAAKPADIHSDASSYLDMVEAVVQEIRRRQLSKVVLSRTLMLSHRIDLVGTYVNGRRNNTPARSFLLDIGGIQAAGFSPEIIVHVTAAGRVVTQPLAGTRALTGCARHDEALRADLLADPKEVFEHSVSVRAAFDELAGVCHPGTVTVERFMDVQERGSVQHLASQVAGRLPAGRNAWHAFAAAFPAVTVTGVSKTAALASIHRHEQTPRGLYGGAVLTVDADGSMDAALALRAVFQQNGRAWLRAGAGIVGHSRPEREWQETCEKLHSVAPYLVPAN
ncbi:salicylate synthase [Streptomyces celluloflavus]|uniref:salicylate synthase n=1 Tax=Streptomyces celluloflavus TaxID=58344 RepID=UPI003676672F